MFVDIADAESSSLADNKRQMEISKEHFSNLKKV